MVCKAPPHPSKTLTRERAGVPGQSPEEEAGKIIPPRLPTVTWRYAGLPLRDVIDILSSWICSILYSFMKFQT